MMRIALAGLMLAAVSPALAAQFDCEGAFHKDTTLAEIEAAFGADNVVTGEVPGPEGTTLVATTIYPDDPERSIEVRWWDEATASQIVGVRLAPADSGPLGIRAGMSVDEVEALNGEPFELYGFFWDYGGSARFNSGALADLPGECRLLVRFETRNDDISAATSAAISGDILLDSGMAELREADVAIREVNLDYAVPQELIDAELAGE